MSDQEEDGNGERSAWAIAWEQNCDKSASAGVYRDMLQAISNQWQDQPGGDWAVAAAAAYAGGHDSRKGT